MLDCESLEIIVIDNHSEDATQATVNKLFPSVKYLRTDENIGAAGRNFGMEAATGEIVITLDDDVSGLTASALGVLVRQFREDPKLGAVNFRVVDEQGRTCNWVHHCKEEEFFDKTFPTYEITEGAVAFRRKTLQLSGYYPETFFLSHEGPDLAFRIIEQGYRVIYSGEICVRHWFSSAGREPWRNYYYDTRNQLWLAARHFPLSYAVTYLVRGLSAMLFYSLRDGYFIQWLKAVRDGLSGLGKACGERKVLSSSTMDIIRKIDSRRPSIGYLIKAKVIEKKDLLVK